MKLMNLFIAVSLAVLISPLQADQSSLKAQSRQIARMM